MIDLFKAQVLLVTSLSLTSSFASAAENAQSESLSAIAKAIAGSHRSPENRARDVYRHPRETLEFFGVQDSMTVVEIWPGAEGWYTGPCFLRKIYGTLYHLVSGCYRSCVRGRVCPGSVL